MQLLKHNWFYLLTIGNAPIVNGLATVVVDGLNCKVVYDITAGGILNGTLVGPRSSHRTITAGPCPINSVNTISDTGKHITCTYFILE